jgi:hypothetical protein
MNPVLTSIDKDSLSASWWIPAEPPTARENIGYRRSAVSNLTGEKNLTKMGAVVLLAIILWPAIFLYNLSKNSPETIPESSVALDPPESIKLPSPLSYLPYEIEKPFPAGSASFATLAIENQDGLALTGAALSLTQGPSSAGSWDKFFAVTLDRAIELSPPVPSSPSLSDQAATLPSGAAARSRLARVTFYWPEEGDLHTKRRLSSTGVRLRDGHCAVDPKIIPYGSVVEIPGFGRLVAVDTGPAVVSRRAARSAGGTAKEKNAPVIDVFCSDQAKARELEANFQHFAVVTWYPPGVTLSQR